jgi:glucose/mannose transport system permease protein
MSAAVEAAPRAAASRSSVNSRNVTRVVIYGLLLLFAAIYLMPLYVMIVTSFKTLDEVRDGNMLQLPQEFTTAPWANAWGEACIGLTCRGINGYFWNSIKMVVPAVAISTLVGAFNGYVLTKWKFPGHKIIFALMLFGCFIPFQVVLIPMARTLGVLGIANSTVGLIFVHVAYGIGFTTLFFRNYYVSFPDELIRAAMMDGAGFFQIFWRIILPTSLPIIVVTVIFQFTNIWNDFLFGVTVVFNPADQPVTVALNNLNGTTSVDWTVVMAAAVLSALPTALVYILLGRFFIRGLLAGSMKG